MKTMSPTHHLAESPPVLEAKDLSKSYGSIHANNGVDLVIRAGTIHGLIGENGAGKSTLLKLLFGHDKPDRGQIKLRGKGVHWHSPRQAYDAGIGMVYQHFQLLDNLSGLDNVILGEEPSKPFWRFLPAFLRPIDRRKARYDLDAIIQKKGWQNLSLNQTIKNLPLGAWQRLEILKLLHRHCDILFMDEPTAVLAPHEIEALLGDLLSLKAAGKTVVLVSHKLPEIMAICDEVTVLRRGKVVGQVKVQDTSQETLASLMIGASLGEPAQSPDAGVKKEIYTGLPTRPVTRKPILSLRGVSLFDVRQKLAILNKISFDIFPGEIVGVAGVEGNGQSPLVRLIGNPRAYGRRGSPECWTEGKMLLGDQNTKSFGAKNLRKKGMGMIPEDRCHEGLILEMAAWENFVLGYEDHPDNQSFGVLRRQKILEAWDQACGQFDIRPQDPLLKAGQFSGGNQQKIILARELRFDPSMLVCCHPTRGVDFAAAALLYRHLQSAKGRGAGILLVSSSLDEIFTLADRIIVLYGGAEVGNLITSQTTQEEVGYLMTGLGRHGST